MNPDRWRLAEIHGALFSLLLKVDVLAATCKELEPIQESLTDCLETLEAVLADLRRAQEAQA